MNIKEHKALISEYETISGEIEQMKDARLKKFTLVAATNAHDFGIELSAELSGKLLQDAQFDAEEKLKRIADQLGITPES